MNPPRTDEFLEFAHRVALAAGDAILPHFRVALDVEDKGGARGYDPVTVADHAAEAVIRAEIARVYADHGIRGEEHGWQKGASGYTWVIDPIDGTRSFILGQMHWATLIALNDGDAGRRRRRTPAVRRRIVRRDGRRRRAVAARRRARTLRTRRCATLGDAVVACTDPKMFRTAAERAAFDRVADRARLTRWGGDCYAYCLLAMGLIDVVIESSLQAYDVQALIPIVEAAGGAITTWDGSRCDEGGIGRRLRGPDAASRGAAAARRHDLADVRPARGQDRSARRLRRRGVSGRFQFPQGLRISRGATSPLGTPVV